MAIYRSRAAEALERRSPTATGSRRVLYTDDAVPRRCLDAIGQMSSVVSLSRRQGSRDETGRCSRARGTLNHVNPDAADSRTRFDPDPRMDGDRDAWRVIEPFSITGWRLQAAEREVALHPTAYLLQANATRVSADAWRYGSCALDAWPQERGSFVVYLWSVCHSVDRVPRRYDR